MPNNRLNYVCLFLPIFLTTLGNWAGLQDRPAHLTYKWWGNRPSRPPKMSAFGFQVPHFIPPKNEVTLTCFRKVASEFPFTICSRVMAK